LANVGLPGTGGFVGEFLTMIGAFAVNTRVAIFAATGVILSAAYALYVYRRVIFGDLVKPALQTIKDLNAREIAILAPLVVVTILMGLYPKPVFDVTSASVANLISDYRTELALDRAPRIAAREQGVVK
jgi:NADH-quinone oxidoreductase subunit M